MNTLDIILLLPILAGAFSGFRKGFIIGVVSLLAIVLGVFGGFYFLNWGVSLLMNQFGLTGKLVPIIAFILIFISVVIGVNFLGKLLKKFVQMILLGGVDKLAGALVGALMWAFLVSAALWVGKVFNLELPADWQTHSILFGYVQPIAPTFASLLDGIIPALSDIFGGIKELMGNSAS